MGDRRNVYRILMVTFEGRDLREDIGVHGNMLLKWICKEWDGKEWAGLIWLRTGAGGGLL